jgi:hypothetical protein
MTVSRVFCLIVFFLWFFSSTTKAQKFDAGLVIGFNTSQISGDNLGGFNRLSPNAGIFVKREVNEKLDWRLEMSYIGKGSRNAPGPDDPATDYYLLRIHYIEVPLMLSYQVKPKWRLEAGPSIGVYVGHFEEDINGEYVGILSSRENFKRLDVSGNLGIIWEFSEKWKLNVRGSNSILPVRNYDQQTSFRLNKGQLNKSIMLRLFYCFN